MSLIIRPYSPICQFAAWTLYIEPKSLVQPWEPVSPFYISKPSQVGLPHHHLVKPLAKHHREIYCNYHDAQVSSTVLFLKSVLLSSIQPNPRVPEMSQTYLQFLIHLPNVGGPKRPLTNLKFVTSDTLVALMSPRLNEKLVALQKPVEPRAQVLNILKPQNVLDTHAKIMLQTRGPEVRRRRQDRPKMFYLPPFRHMHFTEEDTVYIPPPDTLPRNFSFRLEWTPPGPINPPTDKKYFRGCHKREVELAARLGLSGKKYLDSKTRIFWAKAYRERHGMALRKIDVQRSCRVDCKTAASLYTAFKSVGWFRHEFFVDLFIC